MAARSFQQEGADLIDHAGTLARMLIEPVLEAIWITPAADLPQPHGARRYESASAVAPIENAMDLHMTIMRKSPYD